MQQPSLGHVDRQHLARAEPALLDHARLVRRHHADLGPGEDQPVAAVRRHRVAQPGGAAGQFAGRTDPHGNPLVVTLPAVADEVAGAAELVQGKLGGRPVAVVRGRADLVLAPGDDGPGAASLVRAEGGDLFGWGAREAVVRALVGDGADRAPFGEEAEAEELSAALRRLPDTADRTAVAAVCFAHGWRVEDWERTRSEP